MTDPEVSPFIIAEFANFCFVSTHYHAEFNKISDEIISYAKSVYKPVYILESAISLNLDYKLHFK